MVKKVNLENKYSVDEVFNGFKDIDEEIEEYCFACQISREVDSDDYCCDYCPLGRKNIGCRITNGLYENWYDLIRWWKND